MTTRLKNLEVQEVSLVDDPAVPKARYLITKRNDASTTDSPVTDTTTNDDGLSVFERIGKSVMDLLGGAPADPATRARLAAGIAKAAGEDDAAAESATEDVEKAKCPGCGRFMSANSNHKDSDEKAKAAEADAEADEADEDEAEKAADEAADEAEAAKSLADEIANAEIVDETGEEDEAEKAADEAADEDADPTADLLASIKSMFDAELAPIREAIGKAATADDVAEIGERVETLEKRKGISRVAKGSDSEASDDGGESVFGDVIFSGS